MPFDDLEQSLADGRPIRLYQFIRGTQQWTYANGDRSIEHLARVYASVPGGVGDQGISLGGEASTQNVRITGPGDLDVAQLYRGIPPSDPVELVIYDLHFGDSEYRVSWVGEILDVSFPAADRCEITCSPESVSMEGQGLRLCFERSCPHALYGRGCNVVRSSYEVAGTIIGINDGIVTIGAVASYADGWFNSGLIEWPVGNGNYDRRAIETHIGSALTLFGGTQGLQVGQDIIALPGCDQTANTCDSKFNNLPNHGGIRHLPSRSPFDGNPVF